MSKLPKEIAAAIEEANSELEAKAAVKRKEEGKRQQAQEELKKKRYTEALGWFKNELPALVKEAVLKKSNSVFLGLDREGDVVAWQRAMVCKDKGMKVHIITHSSYNNETESRDYGGESWYLDLPTNEGD